ncbi:MAG TPA: gamma-glutamyl-gamma-aminobutyrate hydrolase family protein, partial [Nitrospirae bacterium]|nr:gamma-glutamyl-gamma-aminobutyrate hydrolase family protein [Nitrospirota bacterium]
SYYGEEPFSGLKLIDNRRTDFEIAVFMECLKMNKPVLGICNGMQLMNVALGGSLYQDIAGQIPVAINHGNGYHNINISDSSLLEGGAYPVNTSHHQAVKQTGGGVHIIARSSDGVIEAFSVENQHFSLGVQWHPERDLDNTLNRQVLLRFKEACIAGK